MGTTEHITQKPSAVPGRRSTYLDALFLCLGGGRVGLGGAEFPVLLILPLAVCLEFLSLDTQLVQLARELGRVAPSAGLELQHPATQATVLLLQGTPGAGGAGSVGIRWLGTAGGNAAGRDAAGADMALKWNSTARYAGGTTGHDSRRVGRQSTGRYKMSAAGNGTTRQDMRRRWTAWHSATGMAHSTVRQKRTGHGISWRGMGQCKKSGFTI